MAGNAIQKDLVELNDVLLRLKHQGVTLSKLELDQLARTLLEDVPNEPKSWWETLWDGAKEILPMVGPLIMDVISLL